VGFFYFQENLPRRERPSGILFGGITYEYYCITHLPNQRQPILVRCTSPSEKKFGLSKK